MTALLAALASAALLWAGTGLHPHWWLTWLAPIPPLLFARRAPWWAAALVAFTAWFTGECNMWGYLHGLIGIPSPFVIALFAIPALIFVIAVLLWRAEILRGHVWRAALWPPLVWVAYEYINTVFSPHSTFGSLAYSQMDFLPVVQLASVTGIWGIVFLLIAVPSAIAVLIAAWKRALAATLAVAFIAVLGFGEWRLHSTAPATGALTVRLLATDARHADPLETVREYAAQVRAAHADVTLLPEKLAILSEAQSTEARAIFAQAAAASGNRLIVGLDERHAGARHNDALVFAPDGALVTAYDKQHFIPGLETGYVTGDALTMLDQPSGKWGVIICKDLDFPQLSRQYARAGIGLMLAPAWDFNTDRWLHSRMAVMRGVESGFSFARCARQGVLTLSDNRGRILLERATTPAGFVTAEGRVAVAHANTLYARAGDWFAWLALAALAALIFIRGGKNARLVR